MQISGLERPPPRLRSPPVPPLSVLPLFASASLALLLLPGPAVLFIVARSSAQGTRAGLVSVLGVHAGTVVHVLGAVVGLSAIIVASSLLFSATKVVGGVYLMYLGVKTLRGQDSPTAGAVRVAPLRRLFAQGFVVNVFNPKTALFFLAFLPQFVRPNHGAVWSQALLLGLLYVALGLCTDSMYALAGARVGRFLHGHVARARATRRAEGCILIGLGLLTLAVPHQDHAR